MSNHVFFQCTKFDDILPDGTVTDTSFGYRVFDDHETFYNNCLSTLSDLPHTPEEALQIIKDHPTELYVVITEFCGGFYFNGEFFKVDKCGNVEKTICLERN